MPPFGWDEDNPPPELGWRRKREIFPLDVADREDEIDRSKANPAS
jgi:hypothetical protein